jgi:PHD/YefM family antitoxin component YafN of YafNO toxin-antitoxin module
MTSDVQFVVDKAGEKTAVILSLSEYESLLEDLDDLKIALERKDDEVISFDDMKKEFLENE